MPATDASLENGKPCTELKTMKHIKPTSKTAGIPKPALDTQSILYIVGSVFTGVGTILIAVSGIFLPKVVE